MFFHLLFHAIHQGSTYPHAMMAPFHPHPGDVSDALKNVERNETQQGASVSCNKLRLKIHINTKKINARFGEPLIQLA